MTARHKLSEPLPLAQVIALVADPVREIAGSADIEIDSVAALVAGTEGSLVFCKAAGRKGEGLVAASRAAAIVVGNGVPFETRPGRCVLVVDDPARWFVRALTALFPEDGPGGVHPDARVEAGAEIGQGTRIGVGTYIGSRVRIGSNCDIGPNCTIGGAGLAVEREADGTPVPYPHLGDVVIGDGVRIGANCVVTRGILETTEIGANCQIGNMVNIGHNCVLGQNCWVSSGAILCGSARLGAGARIGAGAKIANHVAVGAEASVGIGAVVLKPVTDGQGVFGVPARPLATMRKL